MPTSLHASIIAPPDVWLKYLATSNPSAELNKRTYLRFLMQMLSGLTLTCDMSAPLPAFAWCTEKFRGGGLSVAAKEMARPITMAGLARMESLVGMIEHVSKHGPAGSYLEAGVWRGGMSIAATAALHVYGQAQRPVYICDSFDGLPRPRENSARPNEIFYHDKGSFKKVLSVGEQDVLNNFDIHGVPRTSVSSHKGYFVDSLPPLREQLLKRGERLAILRADGDMYDSTVDIFYNLYDLVEVGGFVVIDDYGWGSGAEHENTHSEAMFGAKDAILDFRLVHGIEDPMHDIDGGGAWFRKTHEVKLQRERYLSTLSNQSTMRQALFPDPPRTRRQVRHLEAKWANMTGNAQMTRWREGLFINHQVVAMMPWKDGKRNGMDWRDYAHQVKTAAFAYKPWQLDAEEM